MNRRKAIGRIILTGIGGGLLFSGYEGYRLYGNPEFSFAEQQSELITALADMIIPSTPDSPGAREAGATPFILKMLRECTDKPSANNFITGLRDVDDWCHHHFDKPFQRCREEDKRATLEHFEKRDQSPTGIIG